MTSKEIYGYIESKIKINGTQIIVSGEIHKELGLKNRHRMVCLAMRKLIKCYKHEYVDDHTPSGETSTLTIRYIVD